MTQFVAKSKYIFDTSPSIILLEKCGLYTQLKAFSKVFMLTAPIRVMEEFSHGDRYDSMPNLDNFKQVFNPIEVELDKELLPYFYYESTSGEIWVISYARQHPDFTCVIDEMFARNVCNLLSVKVTGTIGIISEMKNEGFLTQRDLRNIGAIIKYSSFYLSKELLQQLNQICDPSL